MIKMVFMIYAFSNSGVERHAVNLANGFAKQGYSVDIVSVHGVCDVPFFVLNDNVTLYSADESQKSLKRVEMNEIQPSDYIVTVDDPVKVNAAYKVIKRCIIPLWEKSSIIRKINRARYKKIYQSFFQTEKPDIVIAFGANYVERVFAAVNGINCKIIDAEMNAHEKMFPEDKSSSEYLLNLLKKTDLIIVQTKEEKSFFDRTSDKVVVINNPINPNITKPATADRKKTIVNFCRLSPQKNLLLLLDAFKMFHEIYNDYNLEIYGNIVSSLNKTEIEYKQQILEKIAETGLDNCVSVLPSSADIHDKVKDCAMFVSSSDYEGLSNSMLEAMAIGLPCVCTDCLGGGTREVMVDHENGLIVPMNDPNAMFRAMKEFVENPELVEKCSRNATKITEKLSVEKITQQWLDTIDSI